MKVYKTGFILLYGILVLLVIGCTKINPLLVEDGVSIELSELRNKQLDNLKYYISFNIPDSPDKNITGHELIEFSYEGIDKTPLIFDFRNQADYIKSVRIDKKDINFRFENEHIIIPASKLKNGFNQIEIEFVAGNRALNRNEDYLYTLFVPDRACTAFPCFDQPSLKAKFQLELIVPKNWIGISNSNLLKTENAQDSTHIYIFEETEPISTYLFAFVAGRFKSVTKNFPDRKITMYHRESDSSKIQRNLSKIFELQYSSLKWLEDYTQIHYPFKKLDFVVIPSFQYSGMEHPGAILYRDSRLFLDESATIRDELNRANLIAHETAHMWFGDLVTMEWFSEVWLKEVFANFIADKIVNPQYPDINHKLNFLINHYPPSYSVDRTKGANPIGQELNNMKNAGTLYGSIIYHKAPIMMKHLELIAGEDLLQEGLQEYLEQHKYANANWNKLIRILDNKTDYDLTGWSKSWVFEPGMPVYSIQKAFNTKEGIQSLVIEQSDPAKNGRLWPQEFNVLVADQHSNNIYKIFVKDTFNVIDFEDTQYNKPVIIPNSNGLGYGYFRLDCITKNKILKYLSDAKGPVLRCSIYMCLLENMLNRNIEPSILFSSYIENLKTETNPQNINLILEYAELIYWRFLTQEQRGNYTENLEDILWNNITSANSLNVTSSFFNTYVSIATSNSALNRLYKIWRKETEIKNLRLSENDFTKIAFELALKDFHNNTILDQQYERITDKERKKRFKFIMPALSKEMSKRDEFFESLKLEKNREKEPWVIDALRYLHHPLRSKESIKYIKPSLEMLEELQITGDIFFPKRWLDATFSGHSSIDAVTDINLFLNENPDYPENLKNKILQSSDLVYRASIIKK